MKRILVILFAAGAAFAQRTPEPLSAWPWFKPVQPPRYASERLVDFVLDREALSGARTDQADLRLYDGAGRELPYVLRVRRDVQTSHLFEIREFNRAVEGGAAQISCDLGEDAAEHNEVEIDTAGDNFRRLAEVQGSPDGARWSTLVSGAILFRFTAEGGRVQQQAISYPVSRFRYLRVQVRGDPQVDRGAAEIRSVRVRRSVRSHGEWAGFPTRVEPREADRIYGRPASIWRIDLEGRIPFQRLIVNIAEAGFSRPFRLEIIDDPSAPVPIASGDLTRNDNPGSQPPVINLSEQFARRLKLTITDDRNPPLTILTVTALGAARQVLFPFTAGEVRLYYGNRKAIAPHYDLGARLPSGTVSTRTTLGAQRENPVYRPEPKPLSERAPWLVYLVLAAASLVLAAILLNLARASARRSPAVNG